MNLSSKPGRWAALLLILTCPPLHAADFSIGQFLINVPARFQGPVTTKSDAQVLAYSFSVPGSASGLQAVIQETDVRGSNLSNAELIDISRRYLAKMLQAVERRRSDFRKSEPATIKLAGSPASEVTWTGRTNGVMNNGRLFCVANGSDILFLHVMGAGAVPDADMSAAIKAIQSMRRLSSK